MKSPRLTIYICLIIGGILLIGNTVSAYEIQQLQDVPKEGDYALGPGKVELSLEAGQSKIQMIHITNRLGKAMTFKVNIEDFKGSATGDQASILLGKKKGPYSLKDYLKPELKKFTLQHGEKIDLPVQINIPQDAEPGGLYGAVIITTSPQEAPEIEGEGSKGQIKLISRIGSLFFIRVKGEAREAGQLKKFNTLNHKKVFQSGPIKFNILYQNTGNVHLVPYGFIEITNFLGSKVGEIKINPYFVMPDSLRNLQAKWARKNGLGYYEAKLFLNKGYKNLIEKEKISFWFLPWKVITIALLVIISFILGLVWIIKNIEIRKKH